jgi:hypothetical protein
MPSYTVFEPWFIPAGFLVGGFVLGLVTEKTALPFILRATMKVHFDSGTLIANSTRKMVFLWVFLAGMKGAMATSPLSAEL